MNTKPRTAKAIAKSRARQARTGEGCRPIIERLHYIATQLREEHPITAQKIAKRFEIDARTAGRDLTFLRDRLGYDFEWQPGANTYRLKNAPVAIL